MNGYMVSILPGNHKLFVAEGKTVLQAALEQSFVFPYNCENGICGTCSGRLLSGTIDYQGADILGLEEEEEAQGYVLFCCAVPISDLVIEVSGVKAPYEIETNSLACRVLEFNKLTETIWQLFLMPETQKNLKYCAGQYLSLMNSEGEQRYYSIANAPSADRRIELHIKHSADNTFTKRLEQDIAAQKDLKIIGPYGRVITHYAPTLPIIVLAGGTGFAAAKALIESYLETDAGLKIHLFWVAKTNSELYMSNLPLQWTETNSDFLYTPILSSFVEGSEACTHKIQDTVIESYPDLSGFQVYAFGPEPMVFAAYELFIKHGLNPNFFYSDAPIPGN